MSKETKNPNPILDVLGKKIALIVGVFISLPVLSFLGLMLFLQTNAGHQWLENILKNNLGNPDAVHVKIGKLGGTLPLTIKTDKLEVYEKNALLVRSDNVSVSWSPWRLIGGTLKIDSIEADSLEIINLPKKKSDSKGEGLPMGISLVLESVKVSRLRVVKEVASIPLEGSLEGALKLGKIRIKSSLNLTVSAKELGGAPVVIEATSSGSFKKIKYALKMTHAGNVRNVQGRADLKKKKLEGVAEFLVTDVSKFSNEVSGDFSGKTSYDYNFGENTLNVDVALESKGLRTAQSWGVFFQGPFSVTSTLVGTGDSYKIKSVDFKGQNLKVSGDVSYSKKKIELQNLAVTLPNAALYNPSLSGSLLVQGGGSIDLLRRFFDIKLSSPELSVQGVPFKSINVHARMGDEKSGVSGNVSTAFHLNNEPYTFDTALQKKGNKLYFKDVSLSSLGGSLKGDGSVDLQKSLIDSKLSIDISDLSPFAKLVGFNESGKLKGDISFDAKAGRQDMKFDVDLMEVNSATRSLKQAKIQGQLQDIHKSATGTFSITGEEGRAGQVNVDSFAVTYHASQETTRLSATTSGGNFVVDILIEGRGRSQNRDYYVCNLCVLYNGVSMGIRQANPKTPSVSVYSQRTIIHPLQIMIGQGLVKLNGSFAPNKIDAAIETSEFPLDVLSKLNFHYALSGKLNFKGALSGSPSRPVFDSKVSLRYLYNSPGDLETNKTFEIAGKVNYRNSNATLDLAGSGVDSGNFQLKGVLPFVFSLSPVQVGLAETRSLNINLSSNLRVDALLPFISASESVIDGKLISRLNFSGTPSNLRSSGSVRFQDGYYEHVSLQTIMKNLNGQLLAQGNVLKVQKLQASDGERGSFSLSGSLGLSKGGKGVNLSARFKDFAYARSDALKGRVEGDITVKGPWDKLVVTSNLVTPRTEVDIFEQIGVSIPELNIWDVSKGDARSYIEQSPKRNSIATLDLKLKAPKKVFVRGRGLESEWKADVRLVGPSRLPVVGGQLDLVRGTFSFNDKVLNFTKGQVLFTESRDNTPILDLEAVYSTKELNMKVTIKGKADAPKISLTSNPSLPEDEILSAFLFGKSISNITPVQSLMLAKSIYSLKNKGILTDFIDKLRGVLGLDVITFKESSTPNDEDFAVTLSIGKYITDKIYISVDQGIGPGDTKLLANVELTPKLSLESEIGATAGAGIGLNYKYDY